MKVGEFMNIENDYVTGIDEVTFNNSLNAPLIYLKLSVGSNTIISEDNNLIIYVDKTSKSKEATKLPTQGGAEKL